MGVTTDTRQCSPLATFVGWGDVPMAVSPSERHHFGW